MFSPAYAGGILLSAVIGVASHIVVTTQNVEHGMSVADSRHDIRQAAARSGVVFTQEMSGRRARRYAPAGWGTWQASRPGVANRGDCAVYWNRARWRLARAYPYRLTDAAGRNGHRWAAIAVLTGAETWAGVCVHMPSARLSTAVYRAGVVRLRALLRRLSARYGRRVVVGGDWNRHFPGRPAFRGFRSRRPPVGTRHGARIDYLYTGARITHIRVIGRTYSDHNGVRVWVRDR